MEAYLAPLTRTDETVERISIESTVGIFRKGMYVYAAVGDKEVKLGIRDTQVSRRQNGPAPVEFIRQPSGVEIQNNSNTSGISIETGGNSVGIPEGEVYQASTSVTVDIGRNTEFRLTIERDRTKVKSTSYVQSVADNLRQASERSPNDVLKYTTELHNFVNEQPVNDAGYERVESELSQMVDRLESKVSRESLRGSRLDEEWIEEIDRVAHQVERLYSRGD